MMRRTSVVKQTNINNILISSVYQIGDSVQIISRSNVLAVQRQLMFFLGNEGNFEQFPIYSKPIPFLMTNEKVTIDRFSPNPFIKVNNIEVMSLSASSVFHIGSTSYIDAESRIKHIRQIEKITD